MYPAPGQAEFETHSFILRFDFRLRKEDFTSLEEKIKSKVNGVHFVEVRDYNLRAGFCDWVIDDVFSMAIKVRKILKKFATKKGYIDGK